MTVLRWVTDPCEACLEETDPRWSVQRATHGDLCARHFMAASPAARAVALLGGRGVVPLLDADEALRRWCA